MSTSGFENNAGFSQEYVLVNDATDLILTINSTGSFTGLASQDYRIYAINYEGVTPTELLVGDAWANLVTNAGSYCLNYIGPYNCTDTLCEGDDLITTATGYTTGGSFEEKYVLVNSSGNIISTNTTGTFSGLTIGDYTVYAVNTDDATIKNEINDLGPWSDVSGYSPSACLQILGPKKINFKDCTPLPISLLEFNGKFNNGIVDLYWNTASEINNDYFTIERSKNGYDFSKISNVKGAGNSNTTLNYTAIDNSPFKGVSYYRLKQTDFDGGYSYSKTITITNTNQSITIHPNPTKDGLVFVQNLNKANQIKIIDARSRT